MSKLLRIFVVGVVLVATLTSSVLADIKPSPGSIPMAQAFPGGTVPGDYWIELDPRETGSVGAFELPGSRFDSFLVPPGGKAVPPATTLDDFIRGGAPERWQGVLYQRGIPIGFKFHFMDGPAAGEPVYGFTQPGPDGIPFSGDEVWEAQRFTLGLTDEGYDEVYVSLNGYIIFDSGYTNAAGAYIPPGGRLAGDFSALGTNPFMGLGPVPPNVGFAMPKPDAGVPNNFIAPFWSDITISDNTFQAVEMVGFVHTGPTNPIAGGNQHACAPTFCNVPGAPVMSSGPGACGCVNPPQDAAHQVSPGVWRCDAVQGYWTPCRTSTTARPAGKLLYQTVGAPGERKFVVQWSHARNIWTGNLATFQVQLWESNGAILFLYKDFTQKADFHGGPPAPYTVVPGIAVGREDWFGTTAVGQTYLPTRWRRRRPTGLPLPGVVWGMVNPFNDGDGFWYQPS
jgi:hypothetical protein